MDLSELESILIYFGDEWSKARNAWMIAEGKKRQKRLLRWVTKKLKKTY